MPLAPASRLGPYEVVDLLGAGAFGEVYSARDTRLGRHVAVKMLSAARAGDPQQLERLKQEALTAGSLSHPNVVSVYDVGTEGESFFIVSELVEGRTLRHHLVQGPLPPGLALDYAAQAARGLAAAHEKGIVHRDLKPENLMVTPDGRVKILDFGIAKVDSTGARLDEAGLLPTTVEETLPGTVLGTAAYMSPEQVRGESVDGRSDLFSLGAILFEMLTGRRAFDGATAAETIASILRDTPVLPSSVPPAAAAIVRRCLEKQPGRRHESARQLAEALDAVLGRSSPGVAAARLVPVAVPEEPPRVAVLPFTNLGREPEQEYFSDGLTEQIIHELTRIRGVRIVAWQSSAKMKGHEENIHEAARQLGVELLLVGSVRQARDRVRIAARLVEVTTGYYRWSETYDRQILDLFAVQEEIARAIAGTFERTLGGSAVRRERRAPASLEAYDLYLRGRFVGSQRTKAGLIGAVECFEQAIALDEEFALAHAGLADALCLLSDYGLTAPEDAMPRARAAALRALDLDPGSGEAHASFALIHSIYDWEWEEAEAFYRRSIELNPGYATAHHWFALDFLANVGRLDEAQEELDLARQLDPLSAIIQEGKPYLLMMQRRYDEALAGFKALADLQPGFYKAYTTMGRTYSLMGRYEEAIAMLERGRELSGGEVPNILGALGQSFGLAGRPDRARELLDQLAALSREKYVPATCFALIHAGLGEHDAAVDWLERGAERRDLPLSSIKTHPAYDSLREHPRFQALLARLRFPG
ncbi:MAG TPA: protein kinase [Vicinamibacterales bacterium]|nr:protein kinase [Vicinamibacterales bacterium]